MSITKYYQSAGLNKFSQMVTLLGRFSIQGLAGALSFLTEDFCGFPQFLKVNVG
jgi:hypothetical protein